MLEKFTWATLKRRREKEGKRRCKKVHKLLQPWGSVWVLRGYLFCFSIKMCNRPTGPITCPLDPLPLLNKGSVAWREGWLAAEPPPARPGLHWGCCPLQLLLSLLPTFPQWEKAKTGREAAGRPGARVAVKKYITAAKKSWCELSVGPSSIFTAWSCLAGQVWAGRARCTAAAGTQCPQVGKD